MRLLTRIESQLTAQAAEWGEVDECLRGNFEDLADQVSRFLNEVDELYPGRVKAGSGK